MMMMMMKRKVYKYKQLITLLLCSSTKYTIYTHTHTQTQKPIKCANKWWYMINNTSILLCFILAFLANASQFCAVSWFLYNKYYYIFHACQRWNRFNGNCSLCMIHFIILWNWKHHFANDAHVIRISTRFAIRGKIRCILYLASRFNHFRAHLLMKCERIIMMIIIIIH